MPVIDALHIYPIKSCRGIRLERAQITRWGLLLDRHWMLVDGAGHFVSQREYPSMARIEPRLRVNILSVSAPGMPDLVMQAPGLAGSRVCRVVIWKDTVPALDEGDVAASWFSSVLGAPVRLVCFDDAVRRQVSRDWTGGDVSVTQFADGFPLLVTVRESLDDLNDRMQAKGAPAIPMERFRPNLVLSGVEPYDEDYIGTVSAVESRVILRLVKPCARCPIPTIDQMTGMRDPAWGNEPLDTLAAYRSDPRVGGGVTFGQNAIVLGGEEQWLRVGEAVQCEWNFANDS
ncbi:MOSC domain-containing protein [Caballeronia sordidicola]|uniref:MOSC domain-containing protein n=1 Tax=Caballeronia sordidicola TaxID=196367 RepID=A0A158HLE0_CABSO|nr:MOSC N-terminal beta barrel domain-containing protein [Caballeronia sordidicola]SAL45076.1 MOSC domain-containing protein [Caballeronia sordidicola]